jgi:hypothetical protein
MPSDEYKTFMDALKKVVTVPGSVVKAQIAADKQKKKPRVSKASS